MMNDDDRKRKGDFPGDRQAKKTNKNNIRGSYAN